MKKNKYWYLLLDQKQIMTADDIAKLKSEGLSTENLVFIFKNNF